LSDKTKVATWDSEKFGLNVQSGDKVKVTIEGKKYYTPRGHKMRFFATLNPQLLNIPFLLNGDFK
jgi:hypothetical protein